MKYDINKINEYVKTGKLHYQSHSTLPLKIYKYSIQTQYSNDWDEITLNCRGLVLDDEGIVWGNCIPKFFNYNETRLDKKILEDLKQKLSDKNISYEIFDKLDGSIIQIFKYKGEIVVTSACSFDGDIANIAKRVFYKYQDEYGKELPIEDGFTYIFELLIPENRIVCEYEKKEQLVLLTVRSNDTELEGFVRLHKNDMSLDFTPSSFANFPIAERITDKTIDVLIEEAKNSPFINKEGWIVKFADGTRVKIKYEEYFKLHKFVSNINEHFVWESLRDGNTDILNNVPDEFFETVEKFQQTLTSQYQYIYDFVQFFYKTIMQKYSPKTKKDFAMIVLSDEYKDYKNYSGILFNMYENKDISKQIWNMFEPSKSKFNSLKVTENDNA